MEIVADQVSLEKRAHLRVSWTRMIQNHEVDFERRHVDEDREYDETCNTSDPVSKLIPL